MGYSMSNPKSFLKPPLPLPIEDLTDHVLFGREPPKPEIKMYSIGIRALVLTEFINSLSFTAVFFKLFCFQIVIT